jgi:NADH-quinone oxidoreductase subunit G
MPTIEIDGRKLEVEAGKMVIQAADEAGIYIPHFCYHSKLSVAANCRMCMVEVEKAPKPMPACATPVTDGMKIFTSSPLAVEAQKGTMEFLLINHPLDCPVCDQGGECPLQDQAMGYGKDVSRFTENKRVVKDKDIGPLIATEMTRCIHCTRCVRFGQEIAGTMELGATGRGEHMEIEAYVDHTVDSELSGNMIDLCPVGALTNKPYRFTARAWELVTGLGVSPHDCVGSNIEIHSLRNVVKRVLPVENDEINECWLSDRDRFSYQSLNSGDRLLVPKIREAGKWMDTDWETALRHTVQGVRAVLQHHSAQQLGALVSPTATLEEFYLTQKLMRSLGCHNVDHRLRQSDFSDDDIAPLFPALGSSIEQLEQAKAILLIGANIRKDQPLLGLRVRKAYLRGARIMAINSMDYSFHFDLAGKAVVAPEQLPYVLARVVAAMADGSAPPQGLRAWASDAPTQSEREMAEMLKQAGEDAHIILGLSAIAHPWFSVLRGLAQAIHAQTGARFGILPEANGAAGWLAGCVPHRGPSGQEVDDGGMHAVDMLRDPRKAYLLVGVEPEYDCLESRIAGDAMTSAEFVVRMTAFDIEDGVPGDVLLPITPFSETSGTYVNCEGRPQGTTAVVAPKGDARPLWKVLRVVGNLLDQSGFEYMSSEEVRRELTWDTDLSNQDGTTRRLSEPGTPPNGKGIDVERVADVPLYKVDPYVRRAPALQETRDTLVPAAYMNSEQASELAVVNGDRIHAHMGESSIELDLLIDERVPTRSVYIPSGYLETAPLGGIGMVRIVKL